MKLTLKQYKTSKLNSYIKTSTLFFVFHGVNLKLNNWTWIEQELVKLKLKCYRLNNTFIKIVLFNSILINLKFVLNGPSFFIKLAPQTSKYLEVKLAFSNINKLMTFLCLRINNKLYMYKQLQRISKINYLNSIQKIKHFLQSFLLCIFKNLFQTSNK